MVDLSKWIIDDYVFWLFNITFQDVTILYLTGLNDEEKRKQMDDLVKGELEKFEWKFMDPWRLIDIE